MFLAAGSTSGRFKALHVSAINAVCTQQSTCSQVRQDEAKCVESDTKGVQLHILPVQRIVVALHHPFSVHSRQSRQERAQHTKQIPLHPHTWSLSMQGGPDHPGNSFLVTPRVESRNVMTQTVV